MSVSFASRCLLIGTVVAGASSCLPDYTFVHCGTGNGPAVCFVRPRGTMANPEMISETIEPGHSLQVQMVVSNFDLRGPGECRGAPNCGHIHIRMRSPDRTDATVQVNCDVPGHPYNASGAALQITVNFDVCVLTVPMADPPFVNTGRVFGPHALIAELHTDDHGDVPGAENDTAFVDVIMH